MIRRRRIEIAVLLTLWAAFAWGFWYEPSRKLVETRVDVSPRGWPLELTGLKIAAISDIHAGSPYTGRARIEELVRRVNAAKPDVIVLLGDYVIQTVIGGKFMPPEELAPMLAKLEAPLGVYAVLGNHDWWLNGPRVRNALALSGIRVLENESVRITSGGKAFRLVGLADHIERIPDAPGALKRIPESEPVIALVHEPDYFPEIPERIALTLAGHTHGGQVRLPFLGSPVVPSRYGQRYAKGLITEGGKLLFVTTGVGTSIIPLRFGVPPEYALLTLRP